MPKTLPAEWETERLVVRNATLEMVRKVRRIFNACSYVGPWDPTFKEYDEDEFASLVRKSLASSSEDAETFRLQVLERKDTGQMVGYYHMTYGRREPDQAWLSMFVIDPQQQKAGFGSEVMRRLWALLGEIGLYRIVRAEVFLMNYPALQFWTRQGFTRIVEYRGDTEHTPEGYASLILEKEL
jgi:ribosomal protein S18 acetylase RimI-like enzyme